MDPLNPNYVPPQESLEPTKPDLSNVDRTFRPPDRPPDFLARLIQQIVNDQTLSLNEQNLRINALRNDLIGKGASPEDLVMFDQLVAQAFASVQIRPFGM